MNVAELNHQSVLADSERDAHPLSVSSVSGPKTEWEEIRLVYVLHMHTVHVLFHRPRYLLLFFWVVFLFADLFKNLPSFLS